MVQPNPPSALHCCRFGLDRHSSFGAQPSQGDCTCLMSLFGSRERLPPQGLTARVADPSEPPRPRHQSHTRVSRRAIRSRSTKKCVHSSSITDTGW
jgi:hypothetical protein